MLQYFQVLPSAQIAGKNNMAKRSSSNSRPTIPPSVTPKQGIDLLKRQQQKAKDLLEKRPLQKMDYEN
jgi:hypothetical protein